MKRMAFYGLALLLLTIVALVAVHVSGGGLPEPDLSGGETVLVVSNLAHAQLTLWKAGVHLDQAKQISPVDCVRICLPPGNYFLECAERGVRSYYPVPLTGYRCGPEKDGSFSVTVRTVTETPPSEPPGGHGFARIPAGYFLLGDGHNPRERHFVWLTGYYIAVYETTNEAFREFLRAQDGSRDDANWCPAGVEWKRTNTSQSSALLTPADADYPRFGAPDLPVTRVTWFEANAYCTWLTARHSKERWQYSLPTDAEWEKAARGPDNLDYGSSMTMSDAEVGFYNWRKNPDDARPLFGCEAPESKFTPNRYGLYHVTGNVAEWTQSIETPYNREHPYEDDERNHNATPGLRTIRGGSWYSAAISYLYIPYRDSFQPEHCTRDVGFRIVARRLP